MTPEPYSQPMTRLFDGRDLAFLRSMPGFGRKAEIEFRRRRCLIFRGYLQRVRGEFLEAIAAYESVAVTFPDRRELALGKLRYQMEFAAAMVPAYVQEFRFRWGLGDVDLSPVVRRFDAIRIEIRALIPAEA